LLRLVDEFVVFKGVAGFSFHLYGLFPLLTEMLR
jgi:hypothetical protein